MPADYPVSRSRIAIQGVGDRVRRCGAGRWRGRFGVLAHVKVERRAGGTFSPLTR